MFSQATHPGIIDEIIFTASRSGGPGGQNVNKVSSKIEIRFNVEESRFFTDSEKELIKTKLKNKINNEGFLMLTSQEGRSQLTNKQNALEKFFTLINSSLIKRKKRKASKPTLQSQVERLEKKKKLSQKKASRKFKIE